jgi:hypothetical protein
MWQSLKRPQLKPEEFNALEEAGADAIQALLSSGQLGYGQGADVPVRGVKITRLYVENWLRWKSARAAVWANIGVVAAILAAIFGLLAILK